MLRFLRNVTVTENFRFDAKIEVVQSFIMFLVRECFIYDGLGKEVFTKSFEFFQDFVNSITCIFLSVKENKDVVVALQD